MRTEPARAAPAAAPSRPGPPVLGGAEPPFAGLKVLVVHDWIASWTGSERCVEQILAVVPQADLVVGFVKAELRDRNAVTRRARETWLARLPGARRHHRWFLPLEGAAFAALDTTGYDLVISSSHALSKAVRAPRGGLHVCYCHTPPRYLWDLHATYRKEASRWQRAALAASAGVLRRVDRWAAGRVDAFLCNSRFVAERVRRCYGREARVVYPPVAPKPVGSGGGGARGDFALSLGRLVHYKRVDLAVAAARRAGLPLVVAGDGPERARLERLAAGAPGIRFVGEVSEEEAGRLYETCRLLLFCGEEDFGIAPLEANAHGAPVVALARGGVLETMVPGVTAELFAEPRPESAAAALRRAWERAWDRDRLRAHARRFAPERFRQEFRAALADLLETRGRSAR